MTRRGVAVLAVLCWSAPAVAVHTPQYGVPYVGAAASTLSPDTARRSDAVGTGYQIWLGYPIDWLSDGREAIEIRLLDHQMRRDIDKSENFQTGVFAEYVYDLGTRIKGEGGFLSGTKLFALAGFGAIQEDNFGRKQNFIAVSAGAGLLVPLGFKGWALRLDGRVQAENNDKTCDEEAVAMGFCDEKTTYLVDYMVAAGLQIPLTIFFDRPVAVPARPDCPTAVVDPDEDRSDCVTDSDRDGVPDGDDQCPGSQPGDAVDRKGCTRVRTLR